MLATGVAPVVVVVGLTKEGAEVTGAEAESVVEEAWDRPPIRWRLR